MRYSLLLFSFCFILSSFAYQSNANKSSDFLIGEMGTHFQFIVELEVSENYASILESKLIATIPSIDHVIINNTEGYLEINLFFLQSEDLSLIKQKVIELGLKVLKFRVFNN